MGRYLKNYNCCNINTFKNRDTMPKVLKNLKKSSKKLTSAIYFTKSTKNKAILNILIIYKKRKSSKIIITRALKF